MPIDYSPEDLLSRWEEFFESSENRLKVMEVADRYPEVRSIFLSYSELDMFDPEMASQLLRSPDTVLPVGEQAIKKLVQSSRATEMKIHLRVRALPKDSKVEIRMLRSEHLGKLISVEGLVRKATEVRPRIVEAHFKCFRCPAIIVEVQDSLFFREPLECYKEQNGCGRTAGSTKFQLLPEESKYIDTQKIEIQENPEGLRGGAQPERLSAYVEDDMAGKIAPGDRISLNGVLRSVQKGDKAKSTLFEIHLDILSIESKEQEYEEVEITEEDEKRIQEEARSEDVFDKIIKSISPTIKGYDEVKESIALQLFGGASKELDDGTKVRGDIHILLVGDPGVAKCVTSDAQVMLGDGSLRPIGQLVEENLAKFENKEVDDGYYAEIDQPVLTFTQRGLVEVGKAVKVWKLYAPHKMLRIDTEAGRSITVTPTHPLFVQNGYIIVARPAKQLFVGQRIAVSTGLGKSGPDETLGLQRGLDWDIIKTITKIEAPEKFVYDLEVEDTHNFIANGIINHNSQMLRYMSQIAPRGIYASGKSSSAAGLCVAPDSKIEVDGKDVGIGDFVEGLMHAPVEIEKGEWKQDVRINGVKTVAEKGSSDIKPITSVFRLTTPSFLVELSSARGNKVKLTPETKVLVRSKGREDWAHATDVMEDDEVRVCLKGSEPEWAKLTMKRIVNRNLPHNVYDLTVEGAHCFIANGFLVHNTAAAVKDDFGEGRWTLEAGALVLADRGVACVDEMDKMTEQDRSSMHEAMEAQRISVAKAGITATLQSRTSVLGAANPKYGRFDENESLADQINMPPALLSRFDLIFALLDKPNQEKDAKIAEHILKGHTRGEVMKLTDPSAIKEIDVAEIMRETDVLKPYFETEFIRKYVKYAKRITPVLSKDAQKLIFTTYLSIRKGGEGPNASVPITARQLEAFIRLSEAAARIRLSHIVTKEDAERAVRIVRYYLDKMAKDSGAVDVDKIMTGTTRSERSKIVTIRALIQDNSDPHKGAQEHVLMQRALEKNLSEHDVKEAIRKMKQQGEIYETSSGYIKLVGND